MRSVRIWLAAALIATGIFSECLPSLAQERTQAGTDAANEAAVQQVRKRFEPINRVLNTLHDKTEIDFSEVPLGEALKFIGDRHKIAIVLDSTALKDLNLDPWDTPVTITLRNISLRSALGVLLDPFELAFVARRDGSLLITSNDKACETLETRVHDVRELTTDFGKQAADYDSLIEVVTSVVDFHSWHKLGGPGKIDKAAGGSLVICQTQANHNKIADLFSSLRQAGYANEASKFDPIDVRNVNETQTVNALVNALETRIDFDFDKTPLILVLDFLQGKIGAKNNVNIQLDLAALRDINVDATSAEVSFKRKNAKVAEALKTILDSHGLTYVIKNEVVLITSKDEADAELSIRLYAVADLVKQAVESTIDQRPRIEEAVEDLVEMITSTVHETSWSDLGGPGRVETFDLNGTVLVVAQTEAVHDQIDDLLAQLRAVRRKQRDDPAWQPAESPAAIKPDLRVYLLRRSGLKEKNVIAAGSQPQAGKKTQDPGGASTSTFVPNHRDESPSMSSDEVLQSVVALIDPDGWHKNDTLIRSATGRLIVRQTPRVHRKIEKLLRQLDVFESVRTESSGEPSKFQGGFGGGGSFRPASTE